MEERIRHLEERDRQHEASSMTLLGVVKAVDGKVDELTGAMRSVQAQEAIVDARLNAMNVRLDAHEKRLSAMGTNLQTHIDDTRESFHKVAQAQEQMERRIDVRMDTLEAKIDATTTEIKQEMASLKEQVLGAFEKLLEVMETRKEE